MTGAGRVPQNFCRDGVPDICMGKPRRDVDMTPGKIDLRQQILLWKRDDN